MSSALQPYLISCDYCSDTHMSCLAINTKSKKGLPSTVSIFFFLIVMDEIKYNKAKEYFQVRACIWRGFVFFTALPQTSSVTWSESLHLYSAQ